MAHLLVCLISVSFLVECGCQYAGWSWEKANLPHVPNRWQYAIHHQVSLGLIYGNLLSSPPPLEAYLASMLLLTLTAALKVFLIFWKAPFILDLIQCEVVFMNNVSPFLLLLGSKPSSHISYVSFRNFISFNTPQAATSTPSLPPVLLCATTICSCITIISF